MGLTTRTLPSVSNGISKQPPILRSPDQNEDELNTWGRIASGLSRRPPTEHIEALAGLDLTNATVHHINRDINERYVVIMEQGAIRVFDQKDGTEKTVNAPGGWAYMDAPGTAYRAVTVADFTFIVNTEEYAQIDPLASSSSPQPTYHRWLSGTATNRETDGTTVAPGSEYQYAPNPTEGTLQGSVQKFEDLPATPAVGDTYEVLGSAETGFLSFYVRYSADGVWDETVRPGLKNVIDPLTMPHGLVREADGSFTFAPFSWKPRRVGDNKTNPFPPFIGRRLRDVFFYQNRLGFLVDETVVFSAAGDYGDYWRRTVLDFIDSDVVAVSATTTDVAVLDYAIPFNDGMVLFSAQRQFSLTNGEAGLTATSVSIQPITGYVMSRGVRPAPLGNQVYFASDAQGYVALQEYTKLDGEDALDAIEVTAHVPRLVPKGVSQVIGAADMDAVFLLTRNAATAAERQRMYAYQFFWDDEGKIQSAWRVWDFEDCEPISAAYTDGSLHVVVKRADGYFLEKINLSPGAFSDEQERQLYLDRQTTVTGVYDPGLDTTTFTIPYVYDQTRVRLVRSKLHAYPESLIPPNRYEFPTTTTITVPGDESGSAVSVGHVFTTRIVFSQQFPLDNQGRPLTSGRLQLHTFTVNYSDTAYFRAQVQPYGVEAVGEQTYEMEFTGRVVGSGTLKIGHPTYHSGSFQFPVGGNSKLSTIAIVNDGPFGTTLVSAEWSGLYFNRSVG